MQPQAQRGILGNSAIPRWCSRAWKVLSGLLSALLLLAVPAYALDFSQINWNFSSPNSGPFLSVGQTTSNTDHSILTFTLQTSSGFTGTLTQTGTLPFAFFDFSTGSTLNATWSGLSALNGTGTVAISITVTDGTNSANMFSSPPQPINGPISGADLSTFNTGGSTQISVQFAFNNFSQSTGSTSFTLDFHN